MTPLPQIYIYIYTYLFVTFLVEHGAALVRLVHFAFEHAQALRFFVQGHGGRFRVPFGIGVLDRKLFALHRCQDHAERCHRIVFLLHQCLDFVGCLAVLFLHPVGFCHSFLHLVAEIRGTDDGQWCWCHRRGVVGGT